MTIFIRLCWAYCIIVFSCSALYFGFVAVAGAWLANLCRSFREGVCNAVSRLNVRAGMPLDVAFFGLLLIPALLFQCCLFLGPLLGWAESWDPTLGIEYMLSNMLGLTTALTAATPTSPAGIILAIVVALIGMLITTTALGWMTTLISTTRCWTYRDTLSSFLFWVLVFVPLVLLVMIGIFGAVIAWLEDWVYKDGLCFVAAQMCNFATPLIELEPETGKGRFVEVLTISIQVLVQSVILDIIGSHPVSERIIKKTQSAGLWGNTKRFEATSWSCTCGGWIAAEIAYKKLPTSSCMAFAELLFFKNSGSGIGESHDGEPDDDSTEGEASIEYWKNRAARLQVQLEALQKSGAVARKATLASPGASGGVLSSGL